MSTNHKPATPLPWFIEPATPYDICAPDQFIGADRMSQAIAHVTADGLYRRGVTAGALIDEAKGNAAYIAHAANAYPKLVEALRAVVKDDPTIGELMDARALLRELGEDA